MKDQGSGQSLNTEQACDEMIGMLVAGHETTASALTWALYLLAQNPAEASTLRAELRAVLDLIHAGFFEPDHPELFRPLINSLLEHDPYMLLADYASYVECQAKVSETFKDQARWTRMAILNLARMGKFSSDRTIRQYAEEIWRTKPVPG